MFRKSFPIAALTLLFIASGYNQDFAQDLSAYSQAGFGNPLDTPFVLAGTFGEIRNDHFHTGIDLSTGNETGKPVYAIADGYVSRIKISAGGFGRALYITHPNGFVSVYAHLKNFSEPVEKYIRKVQYRKESFEADEALEPNKIKVKKGNVIGLSGNSGSSTGPHLHFEIRDERTEEPINPFLFGYTVSDTTSPRITAVRLYPVAGQGVVVNADRPRTYDVVSKNGINTMSVSDYVQVFGKLGFEFSMNDFQNNNTAPLGIYSMVLTVDTQQVFSMKYDRLNFNDSRYVNAHIDYEAKYDDEGIFERCFRLTGDKLKLYGDTASFGYFEFVEDGVHDVTLTVKDFWGNTSSLNFQLISYSSLSNANYTEQPADYFAMIPDKGLAIHKSDIEIVLPANSIYETLLFTNSQAARKPGYFSPTYEIGNPRVPLHLPITVSIRPQSIPDDLKPKAVLVSFDKRGKPVFEGNDWNNEFLSAKTRHFGSFAIAVDTIAPVIIDVSAAGASKPEGAVLCLKITDNLSGIRTYRAVLDGKWFLLEYDAKNNLLTSDLKDADKGKSQTLVVTVTDMAGNAATATINLPTNGN